MDPFAAESLTALLSPEKDDSKPVRPYAPSAIKPPARDLSELFVDDEIPETPSKAEKVVAPKVGAGRFQGNRIFGDVDDEPIEERVPYKANPKRFDHFEIGGDNSELEVKEEPKRGKSRHQSQWDFSDFTTPVKPARKPHPDEVRHFNYGDEGEEGETPPARPHVPKPRRDAEVHFDMTDDKDEDDNRMISSYRNRGQQLYENRLFDDNGEAMPTQQETQKQRPLSVVGNNANRKKDFDAHWRMTDYSPEPTENARPIASDRAKAVKQMESQWDTYGDSPEPKRPATRLHNPSRHNQPSWTLGDEE